MKTILKIAVIFIICFLSATLFATSKTITPDKEAEVKQWLKNQPLAFIENKGQFTTTEGKSADNVLFKTTYGNCDIYITTEGLSYVFVKREVERSEIPKAERFGNRSSKTEEERQKLEDRSRKSEVGRKDIEDGRLYFGEREEENKKVSYYRLDMNLAGAKIDRANIIKEQAGKQGHYNYFYAHCPEGIYGVQEYGKITIKNIYPGIDWVIYTNTMHKGQPLKYDFVVHPQANYKDIKIKFLNAQHICLSDKDTKLKIQTIAGTIEEGNLFSYISNNCHSVSPKAREESHIIPKHLKVPSDKCEVKSTYKLNNDSTISFEIANYDTTQTLIIDPLVWATYYGGNIVDEFASICVDNQDNIFITGYTYSTNFPPQQLAGAYWQPTNAGGGRDIVILKFNNHGVRLWATYYGSSGYEEGFSICTDSQDNIYITGSVRSSDFPMQQLTGAYWQPANNNYDDFDVFILKFNNQGIRLWATRYGGGFYDEGYSICVDSQDNIYITGYTSSSSFPTQQLVGAYWQPIYNGHEDAFILKFNNQGVRLWATCYGGSVSDVANSICVDSQDNIYITGGTESTNFPCQQLAGAYWQATNTGIFDHDVFILKFDNQGIRQWATYYGGSDYDNGKSICVDSQDNVYITGDTRSTNFPVQQLTGAYWQANYAGGYQDVFILKFNSQGQRQWATYYGGSDYDEGYSICADIQDNIYITGRVHSPDFPIQPLTEAYNQLIYTYTNDYFTLKFNNQGVRQWATYYGACLRDIAFDSQNSVYFVGNSYGTDSYTVNYGNGAYYSNTCNGNITDAYILKIIFCNVEMPDSAISSRNIFCANDNGSITLTATGGKGNALKWYTGSCGQTHIGNGISLTIPSPAQTTTYYARWESCDTSFSDCVSITVNVDTATTAAPSLALSSRNNFCANDNGNITLTASGGRGNTLQWFTGGCGQTYIGSDTLSIPSPAQTTTYYARWVNQCDTSACASITVNVNPLPIVNLGNDAVICEGQTIQLSIDSIHTSYLWQNGSTNSSFIVSQPGVFWLTVNYNNCFNSDTITFTLCEPPLNIWVPNSFTPNGDGKNDVFKIESINKIKNFHLYIYNRWGQIIFESNDINRGWDGKHKGRDAQSGVYVWKLFYTWEGSFNEYIEDEKNGNITLLR